MRHFGHETFWTRLMASQEVLGSRLVVKVPCETDENTMLAVAPGNR
jgi:hypothetical protein